MLSAEAKRVIVAGLGFLFLGSLLVVAYREAKTDRQHAAADSPPPIVPADSRECADCHAKNTPVLVHKWGESKHAQRGIGCLACHAAEAGRAGALVHHGVRIMARVGPTDCGRCHDKQAKEMLASGHGTPAPAGAQGSRGSCTACHYAHDFSLALTRESETCSRCHEAKNHPLMEPYNTSKHAVLYRAQRDKMNLRAQPWVVGRDYYAAPTCATCHLSATPTQAVTHDTTARLAWAQGAAGSTQRPDWQDRRDNMADVCGQCHSEKWIAAYFTSFDAALLPHKPEAE